MCTLVVLRRPGNSWPVLLAANRDELDSRPALPPGRHWPDRREVRAGLDRTAGGSWLGVNDWGVTAAILNRVGTLGPADGMRSRGELVLEALDHADAKLATEALASIEPCAYRPFNLVVADNATAFWVRHGGDGPVRVQPLPVGVSMLTARELNDPACARIRRYRPLFLAARVPDPETGDWSDWELLLGSRAAAGGDPRDALTIVTGSDYNTVSSTLLALPRDTARPPVFLHADGRPGEAPYRQVGAGPLSA